MNTMIVWLLVGLNYGNSGGTPALVVDRFATLNECERVRTVLTDSASGFVPFPKSRFRCIQATVVKP